MVESVSKRLQSGGVSMCDTRALFDAPMPHFPAVSQYLDPSAEIVSDPAFESAVAKLQSGRRLSRHDKLAVASLKVSGGGRNDDDDSDGFGERVIKRARVAESRDRYILIPAVAPTLYAAERLSSVTRSLTGRDRHRLQSIALEMLLFLKCNRGLWDVHTVHAALEGEN